MPAVLVTAPFLLKQRAAWDAGYTIVLPEQVLQTPPDPVVNDIQAIACGGDGLDTRLIDALPNLKLVACFSTGYAGIDVQRLQARGIALTTAAGVNAHDVADHAMALLLALWHGVTAADRLVRNGGGRENLQPRHSLRGRCAGIVGLGRIGSQIAVRAEAHGMLVEWWGPRDKPDCAWPRAASVLELAAHSDVLFIASRAVPENAGQIDAQVLAALGVDGVLVNVSRAFLVDEPALLSALERCTIAGAALDVFDMNPVNREVLSRLENTVLTPHIAGYTQEAGVALFGQLRENLRRQFAGEPLLTPVTDY